MHPPLRLVAIDVDGTLVPAIGQSLTARVGRALKAAQDAGIVVAIATGRRPAYTAPLLAGLGLRADTPLIASNGAVIRTLGGEAIDRSSLVSRIARGLCGLLRSFGTVVFTFDRPGRGELVLEDMEQAQGRVALWVEANRNAIEVVKPLEDALVDGDDPIQGMAAGSVSRMRAAEEAIKASPWGAHCECVRTEYPARDLSILDLLPPGVSKGWALERLAARLGVERKETMAIGDNWNDVDMLEWAGQGVMMGNAAPELRTMAKMRGWKQAPPNSEDGVAVVLEAAIAKRAAAGRSGLVGQGFSPDKSMKYYVLKPEAAGDFGPDTIYIDMRARPVLVKKFHYEFTCWLGDPIVEAVTCFIVTETARDKIIEMGATGAAFDSVEVSTTYPFEIVCKGVKLPNFVWLQITGEYGKDDFGFVVERGAYLVISDRVLRAFLELGLYHGQLVELERWNSDKGTQYRRASEWVGGQT